MATLLAAGTLATAQTAEEGGDVFELSPFEVSTSQDVGYLSTNSTSGTSLNTAIKDLPMAIQVINQDFITDIAASNLDEALSYAAGVFTDDNQASSSVGATRGNQGGGGDRSISSAGQGARFANVVYIRGLSTPYQNRMGFRYGGLVVTPSSDVALGGLLDSSNIERIEVVKGPNSLLYGVGVLSGIVNVIPEKPLSQPHYEFGVSAGSDSFMRVKADITGPLASDWIPGQLNYRIAGAYDTRENWTDFRESSTEYWAAQLDYTPVKWLNLFLEYQDGYTREDGIAAQWIYDGVNSANDTEFRNQYDEAYNWARHAGVISGLRPLDPTGFNPGYSTIDLNTGRVSSQAAFRLLDDPFEGGAKPDSYRITGPDTYADRDEQNFLADLTITPVKNLTINAGALWTEQETDELTLQFNAAGIGNPKGFVETVIPFDNQLQGIWQSGGIYGVPMQDVVKQLYGLNFQVDPSKYEGDYLLPALMDDVKFTEYFWRQSIIKSQSDQYRLRGTYTFETPFIVSDAKHTLLAGYSYIKDDIDFPDGGINRNNAWANPTQTSQGWVARDYTGTQIDVDGPAPAQVLDPTNKDGLYYRSISNFEPIYFDGRNDGVDGHNVVRDGDAYLNQEIVQEGIYGVYQGKFFNDRLEVILGVRRDTYNSTQFTYKRADVTDAFLRAQALEAVGKEAGDTARQILGTNNPGIPALQAEIIAERTQDDRFIATWYRDSFESGDQGYFGYADRGGAPDANYGIVPGSLFDIFEEDVEVTTYTFGANYDITPELTVYGLVAQGVSPNTALRDGAGEIIPAEETLNKELGIKFDLMEGKISGNIALFQIDRENGIWDVIFAPSPSKWADARESAKRSLDWELPGYTPAVPTSYYVRGDYLRNFISEEFGIDVDRIKFAQIGSAIQQDLTINDLDPSIPIRDRLKIVQDVRNKTVFPAEFASAWNSQAPYGGNVQLNFVGINPDGLDDLMNVTMYNPETNQFITKSISNLPVLYSAFADRNIDFTKNSLLGGINPIRYSRFSGFGMPQENNNVDFNRRALVTFDEEINGFEFEVFFTPTENLQFVVNYTHVEREAKDSFHFAEWNSIVGTEGTYVPAFSMLHREYGWENAGIDLAWVDYSAYVSARGAATDGVVKLADIPEGSKELIPDGESDTLIPNSTFIEKSAAGKVLLLVDERGNIINEANNAMATDYSGILSGVSLNFNPEDELSVVGKYTFTEGPLERLSLTAGFKYIGASATSVSFNTVSPLIGLTVTPEVPERYQVDVGASYRWRWNKWDMRLSINIYNLMDNTYDVTVTTLDTLNPVTGKVVTKRTEKFFAPTGFRVGLTASF